MPSEVVSATAPAITPPPVPLVAAAIPPLQVIVCWHAESTAGPDLARFLYAQFARDSSQPELRTIGVPIYLHALDERGLSDEVLRPADAHRTAVMLLVDDAFVADDRADDLVRECVGLEKRSSRLFVLPVGLSKNLQQLRFGHIQAVRAWEWADDVRSRHLALELAHALTRYLATAPGDPPPAPVRVFLSHAKRDGVAIATGLRTFLQTKTGLGDFFDVNDLAPGHSFAKELERGVATAALVVIQTDAYGSREWCQKEVLWAKRHRRPIVVVNAVRKREARMFPYLGNVPSVRWVDCADFALDAAHAIALEVLRAVLFESENWGRHFTEEVQVLSRPPELATLEPGSDGLVLYPDPPLADDELGLLATFAPRTTFVTPISRRRRRRGASPALAGKNIGLSVSEAHDSARFGLTDLHLRDAVIELARHLLAAGATLVYGGDLRDEGFTRALFQLVRDHNAAGSEPYDRIINVVHWPESEKVDQTLKADNKLSARFVPLSLASELLVDRTTWTAPELAWRRALGLSQMRHHLAERCDARVVLGGRVTGYSGLYPGLAEEAFVTLKAEKALFVAGGFGGCAADIVRLHLGQPSRLADELRSPSVEVAARRTACRSVAGAPLAAMLDGNLVADFLRTTPNWSPLGSADAARLESTRNVAEIVELVLTGLGA